MMKLKDADMACGRRMCIYSHHDEGNEDECDKYNDNDKCSDIEVEYQPSGAGDTRSQPATPHRLLRCTACYAAPSATLHRLQNPKWPPVVPNRCLPLGFWAFYAT